MRDLIKSTVEHALRSGDRVGVDGRRDAVPTLGAATVRLARLATSIHLAESARRVVEPEGHADRRTPVRELVR